MKHHPDTSKPNSTNARATEKSFSAPQELSQYHGDPEELPVMAEELMIHNSESDLASRTLVSTSSDGGFNKSRNAKTETLSSKNS